MTFSFDWRAHLAGLDLFDANVRVGPSGPHGALALEPGALLAEMDRFAIRRALAAHFAGIEYDAEAGHRALLQDPGERLIPVWAALPELLPQLEQLRPQAVHLSFAVTRHNFSSAAYCAGELCDYLQARSVLTLIAREDLEWDGLARLLADFPRLTVVFLNGGYRGDRYLLPLLRRYPRLYFDSATYLAHRQLEAFVERMGPERVLFGSRLPLYTPAASLGVLLSARMSDDARAAIAGNNLRRLLAEVKP